MRQILEWPCKKCGNPLNDVEYCILTKYCKDCKPIVKREQLRKCYHKRRKERQPTKVEKMIYLLKTNKQCSEGEILAFCGMKKRSLRQVAYKLRKKGHRIIKRRNGFYVMV